MFPNWRCVWPLVIRDTGPIVGVNLCSLLISSMALLELLNALAGLTVQKRTYVTYVFVSNASDSADANIASKPDLAGAETPARNVLASTSKTLCILPLFPYSNSFRVRLPYLFPVFFPCSLLRLLSICLKLNESEEGLRFSHQDKILHRLPPSDDSMRRHPNRLDLFSPDNSL